MILVLFPTAQTTLIRGGSSVQIFSIQTHPKAKNSKAATFEPIHFTLGSWCPSYKFSPEKIYFWNNYNMPHKMRSLENIFNNLPNVEMHLVKLNTDSTLINFSPLFLFCSFQRQTSPATTATSQRLEAISTSHHTSSSL